MSEPDAEREVLRALVEVTGEPVRAFLRKATPLEDACVDSLALLEIVNILQGRLGIVVPDEVTARIRTVADLHQAVADLVTAGSLSTRTRS
ncbi:MULTISPECIES: acyl carrier protein [unclassified Streptomyces]|uniref:acyl carrier protein n=1 Tax=unclassified Streptomyces TaxID=2593676 RepID=UPI002E2B38B1|nr:acyl carrier protein [Streptomyces sp. NBC_00223]